MQEANPSLPAVTEAWRQWCRTLEQTGEAALRDAITNDDIDLAEGLRYLARMATLTAFGSFENKDTAHPYFWPALDPHRKMGGDNPQGLYLSAPINGTDTFRIRGTRGSARWISIIAGRGPSAAAAGLEPFGHALFLPDLAVNHDGTFEVHIAPTPHDGNWLQSDEHSATVLVRQFFATPDAVQTMDLTIENVTRGHEVPAPLSIPTALGALARANAMYARMVPMMLSEMIGKGDAKNTFVTDIGDPTSTSGGVPGGNAVTARWCLEPHQALLVEVTPPVPCAYWDVQVGNGWYESFDYRQHFSGITCEGAHLNDDGSFTIVLAERDPGTANWLETAGHREGHIAVRWQLTNGNLPIPRTTVVDVGEVGALRPLPKVSPEQRQTQRAQLAHSFAERFGW